MSAVIKNKSQQLKIRGIMLDCARLMEKHCYYFDLLDDLASWGVNTLWWHFVDDQGFGIKLDSHPELATPYAFTKAEMRRLIAAAADRGIEIVPEVETLGHAGYLLRHKQYAHLADGDRLHFNAACPSHDDTLKIMYDLIDEVAELFPSKYFHGGLDEVNFSGCPRCEKRAAGRGDWWIYAQHVKAINQRIASCGKQMIMWADHVEKQPKLLAELPKDIILAHWQYWDVESDKIERSLDAGFEVITAPAISWFGTMIQPRQCDFKVTADMASCTAKLSRRGALGMVNTLWVPGRFLRDACGFGLFYSAEVEAAGGHVEPVEAAKRFCRSYWGVNSAALAKALWLSHQLTLDMNELNACMLETANNRYDALQLALDTETFDQRKQALKNALETFEKLAPKVSKHAEAFNATRLAMRVNIACLQNADAMARIYSCSFSAENLAKRQADPARIAGEFATAASALTEAAMNMKQLLQEVAAEWNRTRYRGDEKKHLRDAATKQCGRDMLLGRLARGKLAIEKLSKSFQKQLTLCRKTGKLPSWDA